MPYRPGKPVRPMPPIPGKPRPPVGAPRPPKNKFTGGAQGATDSGVKPLAVKPLQTSSNADDRRSKIPARKATPMGASKNAAMEDRRSFVTGRPANDNRKLIARPDGRPIGASEVPTMKANSAKRSANVAKYGFNPVVSGTSKNVGEHYSFQQDSNGTRYQKAPSGQLVKSTAAERAALPGRSRLNALRKKMK